MLVPGGPGEVAARAGRTTLEWLRRNVPVFDTNIDMYLKSSGPITEVEKMATGGGEGGPKKGSSTINSPSLGIGSLKGMK